MPLLCVQACTERCRRVHIRQWIVVRRRRTQKNLRCHMWNPQRMVHSHKTSSAITGGRIVDNFHCLSSFSSLIFLYFTEFLNVQITTFNIMCFKNFTGSQSSGYMVLPRLPPIGRCGLTVLRLVLIWCCHPFSLPCTPYSNFTLLFELNFPLEGPAHLLDLIGAVLTTTEGTVPCDGFLSPCWHRVHLPGTSSGSVSTSRSNPAISGTMCKRWNQCGDNLHFLGGQIHSLFRGFWRRLQGSVTINESPAAVLEIERRLLGKHGCISSTQPNTLHPALTFVFIRRLSLLQPVSIRLSIKELRRESHGNGS